MKKPRLLKSDCKFIYKIVSTVDGLVSKRLTLKCLWIEEERPDNSGELSALGKCMEIHLWKVLVPWKSEQENGTKYKFTYSYVWPGSLIKFPYVKIRSNQMVDSFWG